MSEADDVRQAYKMQGYPEQELNDIVAAHGFPSAAPKPRRSPEQLSNMNRAAELRASQSDVAANAKQRASGTGGDLGDLATHVGQGLFAGGGDELAALGSYGADYFMNPEEDRRDLTEHLADWRGEMQDSQARSPALTMLGAPAINAAGAGAAGLARGAVNLGRAAMQEGAGALLPTVAKGTALGAGTGYAYSDPQGHDEEGNSLPQEQVGDVGIDGLETSRLPGAAYGGMAGAATSALGPAAGAALQKGAANMAGRAGFTGSAGRALTAPRTLSGTAGYLGKGALIAGKTLLPYTPLGSAYKGLKAVKPVLAGLKALGELGLPPTSGPISSSPPTASSVASAAKPLPTMQDLFPEGVSPRPQAPTNLPLEDLRQEMPSSQATQAGRAVGARRPPPAPAVEDPLAEPPKPSNSWAWNAEPDYSTELEGPPVVQGATQAGRPAGRAKASPTPSEWDVKTTPEMDISEAQAEAHMNSLEQMRSERPGTPYETNVIEQPRAAYPWESQGTNEAPPPQEPSLSELRHEMESPRMANKVGLALQLFHERKVSDPNVAYKYLRSQGSTPEETRRIMQYVALTANDPPDPNLGFGSQ